TNADADLGLLSYQVATDLGGSAVVTITSDKALPANVTLFKVSDTGVYTAVDANAFVVIDANTIQLTLIDGGSLDQDGEANGVIVDPIAFGEGEAETPAETATPTEPTTATPGTETTSDSGSSSGGGCLVSTPTTGQNLWFLPIAALMLLGMIGIRRKEGEN
ncbi:MAG: choice-of-anchor U domain-containing protein, partial [Mariprofundaceae bacterium]